MGVMQLASKARSSNGQLNGVSMTTTLDDGSDNEFIPIPFASQGVSKWVQPTGGTQSNNHQFNGDMTNKRQNVAPHINRD
jgi:hypothetical protein